MGADAPTEHGQVLVRPAAEADAEGLAVVHVAAWQTAYRGIFSDAHLDGLDVTERAARWRRILTPGGDATRSRTSTAVIEIDGRIWGFASWGPPRPDDNSGVDGELWALYVHPDAWGCGLGAALITEAHSSLRRAGAARGGLWVLTKNPTARRFYEHHGWVATGETRTETRFDPGTPADESRYELTLAIAHT